MDITPNVPLYSLVPFILMLGSIAILPLAASHFWEQNKYKLIVSLILGIPTAIWLLAIGLSENLFHTMVFDYIPFIILLGSLFVITGGIFVDADFEAKPVVNTTFLAIGAVLASFMGTTGAAMLLIRPVIHTNFERNYKVHTILFFIAIVANCGGLLTPLGDPPLFLLYLRGAPFFWFFTLFKEWLFVNALLLIIYFFVDSYYYKKESEAAKSYERRNIVPIIIKGKINFLFLAGVVVAIALFNENTFGFIKSGQLTSYLREFVIVLMTIFSLIFTKKATREANSYNWHPITEVAYLFLGIFITMIPCLLYLEANAEGIGITSPSQFYYYAGALSGFLDNAPTGLTFYSLALGMTHNFPVMLNSPIVAKIPAICLSAISLGAVFFGSMTYIGNGPNFMVKAIAEHRGINMPHFFEYMLKFSLIVLLPVFILAQLLFI